MRKFILSFDSSADMPISWAEENKLYCIPLSYVIDDEVFFDKMSDEDAENTLLKMKNEGAMPKTSQISVEQYREFWGELLKQNLPILHITLSSGLSGTYGSAMVVKSELDASNPDNNIIIVDSLIATGGIGILILAALDMLNRGETSEDTADLLNSIVLRVNAGITAETLEYLKRGGRISPAAAVFGSLLDIKPFISVDTDGSLESTSKSRGRKKALQSLLDLLSDQFDEDTLKYPILISQAICMNDAEALKQSVLEMHPTADVRIGYIGPIIGSHVGPGLIALFFIGKKRPTIKKK